MTNNRGRGRLPYEWELNHRKRAQMWKAWSIFWFATAFGELAVIISCMIRYH